MWSKDGATDQQMFVTNFLEVELLGKIKELIVEKKMGFSQGNLEMSHLRDMKMFYRKKNEMTQTIDLNDPPTWYPKQLVAKKKGMKIITRFYLMVEKNNTYQSAVDDKGEPIELDPMALISKWGMARPVIKIESVFKGATGFSIQMKVWECEYLPTESKLSRKAKVSNNPVIVSTSDNNPMTALMMANKKVQPVEPITMSVTSEEFTTDDAGGDIIPTAAIDALSTMIPGAKVGSQSNVREVRVTKPLSSK
jgi:hypothetical protein